MTEPDGEALDLGVCHGLVVRPGDTLIVASSQRITRQAADHIKTELTERLPGIKAVVMDNVGQLAVYRPEG